jgi:hypothetical protein
MAGSEVACPSCGMDTKLYIPIKTTTSELPKQSPRESIPTPSVSPPIASSTASKSKKSKEKLSACHDCGKLISSKALSCPNCGMVLGASKLLLKIPLAIICLLAIIFVFSPAKWEYRVESPSDDFLTLSLNSLGRDGWQLVSARRATSNGKGIYEMIFKRKK